MKPSLLLLLVLAPTLPAATVFNDLLVVGGTNSGNTLQAYTVGSMGYGVTPAAVNSGIFAIGTQNSIYGIASGAAGHANTVWMPRSFAFGTLNQVGNQDSIPEYHSGSLAIGHFNRVDGPGSLFVGEGNSSSFDYTEDGGMGSACTLIVGYWNHSFGRNSMIVGTNNSISWNEPQNHPDPAANTAVIGSGLISKYDNCLVVGKNNAAAYIEWNQPPPLFVIGNGASSSARSDAFVVTATGDIIISKPQGDISMGIYGQ